MSRRVSRQRGFTLIEMMIAALIGAISIAVAAKVAQVVVKQSTQSRERTDFHARSRSLTRQLRADLRVAGLGSTGAIAFDGLIASMPSVGGASFLTPTNNYQAIPAVTGANNIPGVNVGGVNTLAGSDAIQMVVPDSSTTVLSSRPAAAGAGVILLQLPPFAPFVAPPECSAAGDMVYIIDHTSPTSAGRAQVAFVAVWNAGVPSLTLLGATQFGTSPGTQIMCARISTYWVDDQGWIHRSDIRRNTDPATNIGNMVYANSANSNYDRVSPGVIDMQIAYGMSAEFQRIAIGPGTENVLTRFVFDGSPGGVPFNYLWAEVRMVRVNLLTRTLRRIEIAGGTHTTPLREDGGPPVLAVSMAHQVEWITTTETLNNLNFFDEVAPQGMPADPY